MPLSGWLLLSAVLPLPAAAALSGDTHAMLLALTVLLLLVIVLSLYSRKLLHNSKAADSEQQVLKNLLDQSAEFIAVLDSNLEPTYLNPAFSSVIPAQQYPLAVFKDEESDVLLLNEIARQPHWQGEAWLQLTQNEKRMPIALTMTHHQDSGSYLLTGRDKAVVSESKPNKTLIIFTILTPAFIRRYCLINLFRPRYTAPHPDNPNLPSS